MVLRRGGTYFDTMFPTLSVTLIGLLVGGAVMVVTRSTDRTNLLVGLVGAWVGFAVGALLGLLVDVVLGTGVWVALAGHVLALVAASTAVRLQLARVVSN
jgi:hypothetical protein